MQTYRELMAGRIYNGLKGRESIEWSNYWFDQCDEEKSHRILLVGDSTARMIRSTLADEIGIPVDLLGTSSAIDDELFINQVDAFFNNLIYCYDVIIVQLGHHSRIGKDGSDYQEKDYIKFEEDLLLLTSYLQQHCKNVVLASVFMSVIPFTWKLLYFANRLHLLTEKPDKEVNAIKEKKNRRIKKVSESLSIPYIDVCGFMEKQSYTHIDHIHYENRAKKCISRFFISSLKRNGILL